MTVESASFISGLVPAYPPGSDSISEGDDHLRLIKSVLQGTFPNANAAMNGIHTGTSAPTSTSAGQLWFDTNLNVLKIRNEADAAFVTLGASPVTDFKILGSNTVGWIPPTADGSPNQFLTTDGSGNLDWASSSGDELPSQTGHSGKFLTTNGTAASWDTPADTSGKLLAVAHNYRSGYTDIGVTSMTDSGLSITYTKLSATSTLYVDVMTPIYLAAAWTGGQTTQTGYIRLVYATSTTTGVAPSTSDDVVHIKENGMEAASGTVQLGFGSGYLWKITGLAAAAYTFKVQGKVAHTDGSIEFVDGTIRLMEVEA